MHVLCTAGHVDHGKSALVRALTGMEPDRFEEERRRGLTIDLGFAWATIGPHTVAFVDLPGHERFITNMLAGAGPVETALFVVAADEGWMPQSREHLEILDLLGVRRGVVALTKADLVDAETLEIAETLVRERLAGSSLEEAHVVPVSAVSGTGLDALRGSLTALLDTAPPPRDEGRPRLWVDRSFSVRGAGTVVTGTLGGGGLSVGDEVVVLPGGRGGRVRALESLKQPLAWVGPGTRVAVNLSGVDRTEVRRGDALALPGQWLAVDAFEAELRVLGGLQVDRRGAWHVHVGSAESLARVRPIQQAPVTGTGLVRVELRSPLPLCAGDRFVLRDSGRQATVGGGVVLDPDPPGRATGPARDRRAEQLVARAGVQGDGAALLELAVQEREAYAADRAAAAAGLRPEDAEDAARARGLLPLGDAWAHPQAAGRWADAVRQALARHHERQHLDRVAPKDVATRAAEASGCPVALSVPFVETLARMGRLVAEGPGVRLPDHVVELSTEAATAREQLLEILASDLFAPPRLHDAAQQVGASPALVKELEARGDLVRLSDDLAVVGEALAAAADRLRTLYEQEGPFTAARAKEALGTTRKFALPILEALDRRGVTRREGDLRHCGTA